MPPRRIHAPTPPFRAKAGIQRAPPVNRLAFPQPARVPTPAGTTGSCQFLPTPPFRRKPESRGRPPPIALPFRNPRGFPRRREPRGVANSCPPLHSGESRNPGEASPRHFIALPGPANPRSLSRAGGNPDGALSTNRHAFPQPAQVPTPAGITGSWQFLPTPPFRRKPESRGRPPSIALPFRNPRRFPRRRERRGIGNSCPPLHSGESRNPEAPPVNRLAFPQPAQVPTQAGSTGNWQFLPTPSFPAKAGIQRALSANRLAFPQPAQVPTPAGTTGNCQFLPTPSFRRKPESRSAPRQSPCLSATRAGSHAGGNDGELAIPAHPVFPAKAGIQRGLSANRLAFPQPAQAGTTGRSPIHAPAPNPCPHPSFRRRPESRNGMRQERNQSQTILDSGLRRKDGAGQE